MTLTADAGTAAGQEQAQQEDPRDDDAPRAPLPPARALAHARALRLHRLAAPWAAGAVAHSLGLGDLWDVLAACGATTLPEAIRMASVQDLGPAARACAAAAAVWGQAWAGLAAVTGPGGPRNALALMAAAALELPWWLRDAQMPAGEDEDYDGGPADREPSGRAGWVLDTWREYVACDGGPLPGTRLENARESPDGVTADIVLKRGQQVTSEALRKWEHVASAYDLDETQVLMETHPQRRKSRARLTVLDRDLLADVREWNGSTLDMETGIATVGAFFDGQPMRTRFFVPGSGAAHEIIAGNTGSGKSTGVFLLIAETTDPDRPVPVVNFLIDPEEGAQSQPLWARKLKHAYLGEEKAIRALRGLDALMEQRSREMSAECLESFAPAWERPLVNVFIEESRILLKESRYKDEARAIILRLCTRGRKRGIAVKFVALVPSLEELDSQTLRSMLRAFDVWCFRTGDSVSGGMLGLQVDPSLLPETFADGSPTWGLSYLKGPDGRQAIGRSLDIPPHRKAEITEAAAECPLDASSLDAFEAAYAPPATPQAPSADGGGETARPAPDADIAPGSAAAVILAWLAAHPGEHKKAEIALGIRPAGITSLSTVGFGLRQLVDAGLAATGGDKKPYEITAAGREAAAAMRRAA